MKYPKDEIAIRGATLVADLWYPGVEGNVDTIEVGLVCVRAADSIRIKFDYERNGYSILQASTFEWEEGDELMDSDWQEVAFIEAWVRKIED